MADDGRRKLDLKQYSYKATSNLVLRQERTGRGPRPAAGTDEVTALQVGALGGRMGDRSKPDRHTASAGTDSEPQASKKRKTRDDGANSVAEEADTVERCTAVRRKVAQGQFDDVVAAADEIGLGVGELGYVPKSQISQRAFEGMLAFVMSKLGDRPRDVLRDAAEEALATLKDQSLREQQRKKAVEGLLGSTLFDDEYARLSAFGRQIKDYGGEDADDELLGGTRVHGEDTVDEEQGVAVVFDDEEDIDDSDLNRTGFGAGDEAQYFNIVVEPDDDSSAEGEESALLGDEAVPMLNDSITQVNADRTPNPKIDSEQPSREVELQPLLAVAAESEAGTRARPSEQIPNGSGHDTERALKSLKGMDQRLNPLEIDAYWLQRQLSTYYFDPQLCQEMARKVYDVLSTPGLARGRENQLVVLLGYDKFALIKLLLRQRTTIVYCVRRARASSQVERLTIENEIANDPDAAHLLPSFDIARPDDAVERAEGTDHGSAQKPKLRRSALPTAVTLSEHRMNGNGSSVVEALSASTQIGHMKLRRLNLDELAFSQGSRILSSKECRLPGTVHQVFKDYEEWHVPARRAQDLNDLGSRLVPIESLPEWARPAFPNASSFNYIQSQVFKCAFESDENLLLCAPTGAGKTNVAVLGILRAVANAMTGSDFSSVRLGTFKVVYVAPMKALVAEVVGNLRDRLEKTLGVTVRELTGDINLTALEIDETNIIVTTPEKWDIITRKAGERTFTALIRLMIIDEIHLLHDERGPVLEAIVARTVRAMETTSMNTRILGLSATLPNYRDVANFMRVNVDTGLFHFDSSYRPCPLQQCFIGIAGKKALRRFQVMNEVTYDKTKEQVITGNQVIVFVHSRKDTGLTARHIVERAIEEEIIDRFLDPGSSTHNIIKSELANVHSQELGALLERGVAIHNAGMTRKDRTLVEDLFEGGHVKVLVSTATLAWGVNLPAHAVIIRGTQVYSPERGRWVELSPMDVIQMMGRAGRPQFDTQGEGYIITTKPEVLFYLSILNQQLPIESQMLSCLSDSMNAEIAIGSVSSVQEGSIWLGYTYLFVRMLRNPKLYGVPLDELQLDPTLQRRRLELVHTVCLTLDHAGLVRYNRASGVVESTNLGRIASDYYIGNQTMAAYSKYMKPALSDVDLFRLFAISGEFKHMRVREEERLEILRLADRVPIPVKESLDEPAAKANVLLQAYISNLKLDGLALASDTMYVTQSAARLARALLQMAIERKWANLVERCLNLYKAISKCQWTSQTPLRQFIPSISDDVLRRVERKDIDFDRYYELSAAEVGEMLRNPSMGKTVHRLVHSLPRMELEVTKVQPMTRALLRIELTLSPDFRFDSNPKVHGVGESFWVWVEDADSEAILHIEPFYLRSALAEEEFMLTFMVPITHPSPPQYFLRCASDRWIVPDSTAPVSFHDLILPSKFPPHTELLDLQPLSVQDAFAPPTISEDIIEDVAAYEEGLSRIAEYFGGQLENFNPVQTQAFDALFKSGGNCIYAAPAGSGRMVCAELAIARLFVRNPIAAAVFVVGRGALIVDRRCDELREGLGKALGLTVGRLSGESSFDIALLRQPGVVGVATPEEWDMFSRRWQQKREGRAISLVQLVVLDDLHFVSEEGRGAVIEVVGSRMRYIGAQALADGISPCRIVALMDPVANAKDIGQWLGASPSNVLSFPLSARPGSAHLHIEPAIIRAGGGITGAAASLVRPVIRAIRKHSGSSGRPIVVFVPSRRLTRFLALELVTVIAGEGDPQKYLHSEKENMGPVLDHIAVETLRECVSKGIGYVHEAMPLGDLHAAELLFRTGTIQILISTSSYSWKSAAVVGHLAIIAGTSQEEAGGYALRRAEYPVSELRHMIGRAGRSGIDSESLCVILTEPALVDHYRRLLEEPLPVESTLDSVLPDQINAEIAARVIQTKQQAVDFLTWTLFYRRLPLNPNYYNMPGNSHRVMQDHLSDLIEDALSVLESSKCVATAGNEDMDLASLNLGMIASHYYVRYTTIELFASQITAKTKLRGLLSLLASAREFDILVVRMGDREALQKLSSRVRYPVPSVEGAAPAYSDSYTKAHLLLQSHLSRLPLAGSLADDREFVVCHAVRLLRALVDVIASAGWLEPAIATMELCQMIVQAMWDSDPTVAQLPHLEQNTLQHLREQHDVTTVDALIEMNEQDRSQALGSLSRSQLAEVASACNAFPDLTQISVTVADEEVNAGSRTFVHVGLAREGCDSALPKIPVVTAPRYPTRKEEGWWIVVGEPSKNILLSLKYVTITKPTLVKLETTAPETDGVHELEVYLMSDSYVLDCDQQDTISLAVVPAQNDIPESS